MNAAHSIFSCCFLESGQVLGDQAAVARAFYGLAVLASSEQNHSQALALLEKARELGGDEEFWYQVTLALVKSTVDLKAPDTAAKVADSLM